MVREQAAVESSDWEPENVGLPFEIRLIGLISCHFYILLPAMGLS